MNPVPKKQLELWKLNKTYSTPRGPAIIVRDFTLTLHQGEFVTIIGHSGCGKSTVLSMVAGLLQKTSGTMILADKELIGAGPDRGVVFQTPALLPWMTALQNVLLGINQVPRGRSRRQREADAVHYLQVVGLGDALHKLPGELSGGMRQRVGIARAFALNPKMLLLDEPFGMLDMLTRYELQQVLIDLWNEDKKTALMVTHDVDEAIFLADRIVMMTSGPAATIGQILDVPFPRPRNRAALLEDPAFYALREQVINFLESQDHAGFSEPPAAGQTASHALEPVPA